ncbi:MAG TPA: DNA-3-methyladenine glycosylase [Micropepsaceae bacterium]|jgi:DNA-3-methyladenine glycosylase|nr:DNA-3-methyladenine glycosylase [Micropepsaceae bacterium]
MAPPTRKSQPALRRDFFARDALSVTRDLIGVVLLVDGVGGMIVEAEAYDPTDPASHSYGGRRTPRNESMFGPAGQSYVYRSYGVHWCLNFVCGGGGAALIRALEPIAGLDAMQARRGPVKPNQLCAGPGRLTQALGITGALDGKPLDRAPFLLKPRTGTAEILVGPRIGITRAVELPWRFGMAGSRFVSRRFAPKIG